MPVLGSLSTLSPTGTVASVKQDVLDALQGRTDVSDATIANYVSKAVKEITESTPFEELRTTGPQYNLIQGVTDYPTTLFVQPGDDLTSVESFTIYIDYPTNQVVGPFKYRTPKAIEQMTAPITQGIPAYWTRFGAVIRVGPTPNGVFTVFMRYQAKHTFSTPAAMTDPLYINDSWFDIVAYAAAQRIAVSKRWNDQATYLHDLLYGDPEFAASEGKRGRPGLIAARRMQVERDQMFDTRQVMPVVGVYGAR